MQYSRTSLFLVFGFLCFLLVGCSSQTTMQTVDGYLVEIGENLDQKRHRSLVIDTGMPVIIIGSITYIPSKQCIDQRKMSGITEGRTLAGDTEGRTLAGDTEGRTLAGDAEGRYLDGKISSIACIKTNYGFVIQSRIESTFFDGYTYYTRNNRFQY